MIAQYWNKYIYIHIYTYVYIYMSVYIHIYACIYYEEQAPVIEVLVLSHDRKNGMNIHIHVYICIYNCIDIYARTYSYICMYIP